MMKACEIIHVLLVCLATALYLLQLSTVDLLSYNLVGGGLYTYESNYFKW